MITLKNTKTGEVRNVQDSDAKAYLGSGWEYTKEEPAKKVEVKEEVKVVEPKKEEPVTKNFKKSRYESKYSSDEEKSY